MFNVILYIRTENWLTQLIAHYKRCEYPLGTPREQKGFGYPRSHRIPCTEKSQLNSG